MTISLGYREPDRLEYTLSSLLLEVMEEKKLSLTQIIIQHDEGVDLIPANIELSALEINLVNAMSREVMLRSIVEYLKAEYDYKYIIIDCIRIFKAAKDAFSKIEGKIPRIIELNAEYEEILSEKRRAYIEYREARQEMKDYQTAKYNIDRFLEREAVDQERDHQKERKREEPVL